jgi:hypothetical protein
MIRLFFAITLSIAAFLGLALRVTRDSGNIDIQLPDPVESIRRLDLREKLTALLPDPAPAPATATATAKTQTAPEPVVERDLGNSRSRGFRESPAAVTTAAEPAEAETDADSPAEIPGDVDVARTGPDQDAWADLLRRMLTVYERVGVDR